jgi:hypothetical protein
VSNEASFEIVPVWKKVSAKLSAELVDLWQRTQALADREQAIRRSREAVCIARDRSGAVCGVGTAVVRVLPRLRQPLYYYRQFFAPEFRGHKRALPFFNEARRVLEGYNESLAAPESIGMLLELENQQLVARYERAYEPAADSTFIGYSPAGLQLRVSYFKNACLLQPLGRDAGAAAKCA